MNLVATIQLHAGGPGSGCYGPNCGRHSAHGNFVQKKSHVNIPGGGQNYSRWDSGRHFVELFKTGRSNEYQYEVWERAKGGRGIKLERSGSESLMRYRGTEEGAAQALKNRYGIEY